MADEEHHRTPAELADRVWELAEKIKFCLFTSWDGDRQRMRPLTSRPDRDEHAIYLLVDIGGGKTPGEATGKPVPTLVQQIERFPTVSLGYADTGDSKYVVITGEALVTNDRAKIKELWTPFAKAWWDSADDPDIRLVTVSPDDAELWDSPGKLVSTAIMLTAAVTGAKPKVGDHGAVRL